MKEKIMKLTFPVLRILLGTMILLLASPVATCSEYNDVDSLGDIWVFTIDKTGSMLHERINPYHKRSVSPTHIADDVIERLDKKNGILDCIDYGKDKIAIYETGYGKKISECDPIRFNAAPSLDRSFIHLFLPPTSLVVLQREGVRKELRRSMECPPSNYCYQLSFVSQIRALTISRIVDYIHEKNLQNDFRNIHLVVMTDDADENDQWRMDYYFVKMYSPKKFQELNELNTKYIYSSFTQQGGGFLEENSAYTDISNARHIYRYDYVTRQQKQDSVMRFARDQLVHISPMDGEHINISLNTHKYLRDTIDFAYIQYICVNNDTVPLELYLSNRFNVNAVYANRKVRNHVTIVGQVQVRYQDSIYGPHMCKFDFRQEDSVLTTQVVAIRAKWGVVAGILLILILLFVFWGLPQMPVLTLYTPQGHITHVRRGYKFQWNEGVNPLLYSVLKASSRHGTIIAKHSCFRTIQKDQFENDNVIWFIDSSRPLQCSARMEHVNTSMNIRHYVMRHDECPQILKDVYKNWWLSKIDVLTDNRYKQVRNIGRFLQRVYNIVCPHYLYWMKKNDVQKSMIITSPILSSYPFLLEVERSKGESIQQSDCILTSYYQDAKCPPAEVLVTIEKGDSEIEWNVFKLHSNIHLGEGIGVARHLMSYTHPVVDDIQIDQMKKRLCKALRKELKLSSAIYVYVIDSCVSVAKAIPFRIDENICMKYLYLVDDTVERKSQMIYSPLIDNLNENMPHKMVVIKQNLYDKELYSSMLPFTNGQNMPQYGACRRESTTKFPAGGAQQGELRIDGKSIKFLNVTIKTH